MTARLRGADDVRKLLRVTGLTRRIARLGALLAFSTVLAACGGSSHSSNPSSNNYDPAHTTLKAAGLEVCSQSQSQSLPNEPGASHTRTFFVAPDCNGKETSPNVVRVYQYSSQQAVDAGYTAIKAALPQGAASEKYGPLVIVVTGPDAEQYLASIDRALKTTQGGNQTTTT